MAHASLTTIGTAVSVYGDYNMIWQQDEDSGQSYIWFDYTFEKSDITTMLMNVNSLPMMLNFFDGYNVTYYVNNWHLPYSSNEDFNTPNQLHQLIVQNPDYKDYFVNITDETYWTPDQYELNPLYAYDVNTTTELQIEGTFDEIMQMQYNGIVVMEAIVSAVPVPGTFMLLGTGLLSLAGLKRKKHFNKV
nr:PEP-CTERM sorting domain-containing protein [uncultured Desulfobacter sp.]